MSFLSKVASTINVPVALQILGVVIFGITVWKGVHGGLTTFGLIAGAAMAYVGRHYNTIYNIYEKQSSAATEARKQNLL